MPRNYFSLNEKTQTHDQKNQDAYNQTKARFFEAQKRDPDAPKLNQAFSNKQNKACELAYSNAFEQFLLHGAQDNPIPFPDKDNISQCAKRKF